MRKGDGGNGIVRDLIEGIIPKPSDVSEELENSESMRV